MTTVPKKSPSYRSHDRDLLPLVFLILEQVNGDVGAAIEFLIAEQGAEECSANSDPLSTNTYATGLELRGLGVWLQWRQGCIRVPLCLWASYFPREYDGACLQMRMPYSPAAHLFLFLVQSTDYNLVGALGLLRILIYKVYVDGTTTMSTHERKTSIREFYAVIYPSLLQLQKGVTNNEDKKIEGCMHGEVLSKRWDNYHLYT